MNLIFESIVKVEEDNEEYISMIKHQNQNLIKPEVFKIFKHVTCLIIYCHQYPLSLESLLALIDGTQINEIGINGNHWVPSVKSASIHDITSKYAEAKIKLVLVDDREH